MDNKERLRFLIQQYFKNQCSKEEFVELLQLSAEGQYAEDLKSELKRFWDSYAPREAPKKVDWDQKYKSIIAFAQNYLNEQPPKASLISKMPLLRAAIVFFAVLGTAILLWRSFIPPQQKPLAETPLLKDGNTATHNRQVLNLPDGSTVVLNTDSKLVYPPAFENDTRDVYLTGEAYFDVKHNPEKPFIVHTGTVTTKVLGTAFNINAYKSQDFVTVTVTRGKVEVKRKQKLLGVLKQNEQISFNEAKDIITKRSVRTDTVVLWKNDDLYFDNITFSEAALILSNKYNVTITFKEERIRNCQFTASFKNNATLEQVLAVLSHLNKVDCHIGADTVFISGAGCD
jgi:ferric-dicitrate binding protein FerR (iron transport regulator)